ncbi:MULTISPECIES: hypothetical protein [Actinomycetaceae]|uniref:hypothetical protein n=1 Tax=Actinomycetaceae TaxID=2049 RepID=UPI000930F4EA|nr:MULTISPECIES: hypothetical protein [Actinomycetaceae]MDP9833811.1 hypothetical protein [Gleimia europaea]
MSIQDFVIYDPQRQTRAYVRPYVGRLRDYIAENESETIADFFNPKRGIILTNRPHEVLTIMQDAYQTITSQDSNHDELIKTDREYKEAFTAFATVYHELRCSAIEDYAIEIAFGFDHDVVLWISDVVDTIHGEDKAYKLFHAPLPYCYALGWQS